MSVETSSNGNMKFINKYEVQMNSIVTCIGSHHDNAPEPKETEQDASGLRLGKPYGSCQTKSYTLSALFYTLSYFILFKFI